MVDKLPENKKIILFDGVCNLCNSAVLKVIKKDKKNIFVFVSLQSDIGKEITNYLNIDTSKIDSIILFEPKTAYYIKSSAAIKIASHFGGFWMFIGVFMMFPKPFRDVIYNFVAKNRYKWFGKKEYCMMPTVELKDKFLE